MPSPVTAARRSIRLVLVLSAMLALLVGVAEPVAAGPGSARYLVLRRDGSPVRWAPDRPIRYVLNLNAYQGDRVLVEEALRAVAEATGIPFVYVGDVAETPTRGRPMHPAMWRSERRSAAYDVVISLADPSRTDMVGGTQRGLTTQTWTYEFVRATVVLNRPALKDGWSQGSVGSVLLHELGHLMGLDHVGDRDSLMYPTDANVATFSPAGWEALHRLGNGRGRPYDPARLPGATPPAAAPTIPATTASAVTAPPATPAPAVTAPAAPVPATSGPAGGPADPRHVAVTQPDAVPPSPTTSAPVSDGDPFEAMLHAA